MSRDKVGGLLGGRIHDQLPGHQESPLITLRIHAARKPTITNPPGPSPNRSVPLIRTPSQIVQISLMMYLYYIAG